MFVSLEKVARELYAVAGRMEASSIFVESAEGKVEVALPLAEDDPLPLPATPFRIVIEIVPNDPPWIAQN